MTTPEPSLDFRSLFEALPGAFLVLDRDFAVVAASDQYLVALGGAKRERLVGRKLFELMPTKVSPEAETAFAELRASFDRVMATGQSETLPPQPYEVRGSAREGGEMRRGYLSVINSALKDAEGRPAFLIHRVQDVTQGQMAIRRLDTAEEARRALEGQHALALAASGMGAWNYDRPAGALTWDARAKELLGIAPDRALTFAEFVELIHPDDRAAIRQRVDEILTPEGPDELSVIYRVIDGEGKVSGWLEARGRATFVDGECVGVSGVLTDVTERQRYEAHLKLLINELNHRVKNTLAVVQSIAMRTLRDGEPIGAARDRYVERLMALAAAHDILTRENWEGADLAEVVERALDAHAAAGTKRIEIEGRSLRVSPRVALSLSMGLHELATNAVKYGALSHGNGRILIGWTLDGPPRDAKLLLSWRETGGPKVATPTRKGFGLGLLERVLAKDLDGAVKVHFAPDGLCCFVEAPASAWRVQSSSPTLGSV